LQTDRTTAWHLLFLSLWKDFGSRFKSIIESLEKQREFVDIEALSIDIVEAKESRKRAQEEIHERKKRYQEFLDYNEKNTRISQLQYAVDWLSVNDSIQDNEYERISHRRHDATCQWIAEEPSINVWMKDDTKAPLLWLNGKPGAGKGLFITSRSA
jgi:hypothetical protein